MARIRIFSHTSCSTPIPPQNTHYITNNTFIQTHVYSAQICVFISYICIINYDPLEVVNCYIHITCQSHRSQRKFRASLFQRSDRRRRVWSRCAVHLAQSAARKCEFAYFIILCRFPKSCCGCCCFGRYVWLGCEDIIAPRTPRPTPHTHTHISHVDELMIISNYLKYLLRRRAQTAQQINALRSYISHCFIAQLWCTRLFGSHTIAANYVDFNQICL